MRAILTAGILSLLSTGLSAQVSLDTGLPEGDPGSRSLDVPVEPSVPLAPEQMDPGLRAGSGAGIAADEVTVAGVTPMPRIDIPEGELMPISIQEAEDAYYEPVDISNAVLPEDIFKELSDIIYQMAERSPEAQIARERLVEAQGLDLVEESWRMPKLNSYVQYNYQVEDRDNTGIVSGPKYFWGVNAEQPIYQWGALEARADIGKLRMDSVKTRNEGSFVSLLQEVRNLYLRIFQRNASIELAKDWLDISKDDLAKIRRQTEAGEQDALALAQAEVQVQQNEANVLTQEEDLEFLKFRLRAISGWTGPILSNFQYSLNRFLTVPVVESTGGASGNPTESWQYQDLQTQIEIENRNVTIANAELLPRFSLVAGIFQDQIDSAFLATSEDRVNYFVGGLVSWSVFDGYASAGRKMAALARKRRLEREANRQINYYRAEYSRIAAALENTRRGIVIRARLYDLQQQRLSAAQRRYDSGAISSAELLFAKAEFSQAQISLIESKVNYLNALGDYMSLTGIDPSLQRIEDNVKPAELPSLLNPWGTYQ